MAPVLYDTQIELAHNVVVAALDIRCRCTPCRSCVTTS